MEKKHLSVKGLFIAAGFIWGVDLFLHAILESVNIDFLMWNSGTFSLLAQIYPGITPTFGGALLGFVWGFFCAGIGAAIFGWIYNKFI